jgi:hypothetical protein
LKIIPALSGDRGMAVLQYLLNLSIRHLPEIDIPFTHREKWGGLRKTNAFVRFSSQPPAGLRRGDRDGNNQPPRLRTAHMPGCSHHGRTRRQTIINQHYGPATEIGRRETAPVELFTALHLLGFPGYDRIHLFDRDPQVTDQLIIQDPSIARDRTHGEFGLPRHTDFTNYDYIQGRSQCLR